MTIESVVTALIERPRGAELLVVGYFNDNLARSEEEEWYEEIAETLAVEGLEDMSAHFLPRQRPWC